MTRAHFTHSYLLNPQHPVTVNLIGAGGTGSQVLTNLARLDATLVALGHPGLYVRVYDPDDVEVPNIGRQNFSPADLGQNKARSLITRVNAFFGLDWEAAPVKFPTGTANISKEHLANIFITCTDNITSRYELEEFLKVAVTSTKKDGTDYLTPLYWQDYGNLQKTGQVVVGTIPEVIPQPESEKFETVEALPVITDMPGYNGLSEEDSEPSCSHAEALAKQDLFINTALATLGCDILWKLFRQGYIISHGVFLNLETMTANPLKI